MAGDDDMSMPETAAVWGNLLSTDQLNRMLRPARAPKRPRGPQGRNVKEEEIVVTAQWTQTVNRLLLRHEDHLNVILSDAQFLVQMGLHADGLVPSLLAETQSWHGSDKAMPLRHHLILRTMTTLLGRLRQLSKEADNSKLFQQCMEMQLINKERQMPYLQWEDRAKRLIPSKTPPLDIGTVIADLEAIMTQLQDFRVTLRFRR